MKYFSVQHFTVPIVFSSLLFISSCADTMATKPSVDMPEGVLNAVQIEQLFSGNSVVAKTKEKGPDMFFFFGLDNRVIRSYDGWQKEGSWTVRDDGRLCVKLDGSGRRCPIIVKKGDQYRQYVVKKSGNHRYELRYSDFRKGNQLAKMSNVPVLPKGTLNREQVITLFSGQTVESVTANKNRSSRTYYYPDGRLEQLRNDVKRYGKWRVRDDARICLQMEDLKEKCRIIVKDGGYFKKYIVSKNGQHQHSVTYRNFNKGKIFW